MSEKKHPIVEITELVSHYDDNKDNLDIMGLTKLREALAIALLQSAEFYSDLRSGAEAADYNRKQQFASLVESRRGSVDEASGKNYTATQLENLARIDNKVNEDAHVEANKRYYRIRLIIDSVNQILNSISSRINITA